MRIDRCICTNRTFASLLAQARRSGLDLDQLMDQSGASRGCGLCRPYLTYALAEGKVVFYRTLPVSAACNRTNPAQGCSKPLASAGFRDIVDAKPLRRV